MVGLSGVVGGETDPPDAFVEAMVWGDEEVSETFTDDRLALSWSFHSLLAGNQPARARDGDALVWVWGDVYGFGTGDSYVPRTGPPDGSAEFCADLYDHYGLDFVPDLNGDFGIVVYDRVEGTVSFVTDRVATRPFYYAQPEDAFVFSSQSQALPLHPAVPAGVDTEYLYEYFQLRRVFGVESPLAGVRELPPGSVATVDVEDGSMDVETYWRPHYEPVDESFESYLDRFTETFRTVLEEWTRDDLEYGVLLSGGSDSRLVQAAMDRDTTAFHIADWMSREARTAREAAATAGDEFRLLERDTDYEAEALERNPPYSNFSGWFDQAYFTGFEEAVTDEVDVLVSGLYADMLFGGGPLPTRSLSLGSVGHLSLPVARDLDTLEGYVDLQTEEAVEPLSYLTEEHSIEAVVSANVERDGGEFRSHGVRYDSLRDLLLYGDFYPMGADTDANFSRSLMHMQPYRTPFLDNRLLDLQQQIPMRYFLRRSFVDRAVERLEPELAELPHARTGMPLKHEFPVDYVGGNLKGFWRKHVSEETPPEPYLDHGPWPDRRALLRAQNFGLETLLENRDLLDELSFLDFDGALDSYRAHLGGEDESTVLYSLLTFLETPFAEQLRAAEEQSRTAPEGATGAETPAHDTTESVVERR